MKTNKMIALTGFAAAALLCFHNEILAQKVEITINPPPNQQQDLKPPFSGTRAAADVAILLDTSNSMDGLIGQAKSQLWAIVQRFANAKKAGQTPLLRVSIFEYGNTNLPAAEGYIRQVVELTDDLDKVSAALFALTTNGGDEYCGMVIDEALKRLAWTKEPNAYKAIFIAGNEPFTQGSVDYQKSCRQAIQNGVVVNTIHCGHYQTGIDGQWKHGAELAEGEYMNIDQDQAVVSIKTPHDKILIELNDKLNKTYLWFGQKQTREQLEANQLAQDTNAAGRGGSSLSLRAVTKAGAVYRNVGRDLVDSCEADEKMLDTIEEDLLPEAVQKLDKHERADFVKRMAAERKDIQRQIAEVNQQRVLFIEQETKKLASQSPSTTLGDAVQSTLTKQLEASGFELKR
jgi:hypothetical protein